MIHLIQGSINHLPHALDGHDVAFLEEVRCVSKQYKNPHYLVVANDRHYHETSDTHLTAAFPVDTRIVVGVVAEHYSPGTYAFARQTRSRFQATANFRRSRTSPGSTDDSL